jgi:DNA polymerase-3 subunit epsilon
MSVLYFDTETTGLFPGQICQLAYIVETQCGVTSKNFYFAVDYVEPAAAAITGLTVPRLLVLSEGRMLGEYIDEIEADFLSADVLVAHNFNFDWSFMRAEFERHCKRFWFKEKFCTMREFTKRLKLPSARGYYKYPSLEEFAAYYGITDSDASQLALTLFNDVYSAHDARYDASKMYLALTKARLLHEDLECYFRDKL